jgi:hypothetical protein
MSSNRPPFFLRCFPVGAKGQAVYYRTLDLLAGAIRPLLGAGEDQRFLRRDRAAGHLFPFLRILSGNKRR